MAHFQVDDDLAFHPKTMAAGNAAIGLWVRAGSYCQRQLTDGFLPKNVAKSLGTRGEARALVDAGLWREVEGGYQFHEWEEDVRTGAKRQESAEVNLQRRKDKARRTQEWRERKEAERKAKAEREALRLVPDHRGVR